MDIEKLQPGLSAEITTVVDDSLVVQHMGGAGVLSTPSMIGLMERAGIQAVQPILPAGYTTVGFEVHVKHFAPTPKGKKVTVRAELLEVDGASCALRWKRMMKTKRSAMGRTDAPWYKSNLAGNRRRYGGIYQTDFTDLSTP